MIPRPKIDLRLSIDEAEYVADVLWSAWLTDRDHGAKEVSEELRSAVNAAIEGTWP